MPLTALLPLGRDMFFTSLVVDKLMTDMEEALNPWSAGPTGSRLATKMNFPSGVMEEAIGSLSTGIRAISFLLVISRTKTSL